MRGRDALAADHTNPLDRELVRRMWGFLRVYRSRLLWAALLLPVATGLQLAVPMLLQRGFDGPILGGDRAGIWRCGLLILAAPWGGHLASFTTTVLTQWVGQNVVHDMRMAAHRHLLGLSASFYNRTPSGRLLTRLTNDLEGVGQMFAAGLLGFVSDLLQLTGIVFAIFLLDWRLASAVVVLVPVLLGVAVGFRRLMREAYRAIRLRTAGLNAILQERIAGLSIVQLFVQERRVQKEFEEANAELMAEHLGAIRLDATLFAIVDMMGSVVIALVLWQGAGGALDDAVTVGVLIAFIEYLKRFFEPVRDLSMKFSILQAGLAGAEKVFGLMDEEDLIEDSGTREEDLVPSLEFRRVNFAYVSGQPVLEDLQLTVERGERVALLGSTGAGKSTLLKLIVREMDVDGGQLCFGGVDLRDIPLRRLRQEIGLVPQDPLLFDLSLRANLDPWGKKSDSELLDILMALGAGRVLDPILGLDGGVGERGSALSVGERQLLALGRVLVYDPAVLLLDEATANLDSITEALVQAAIQKVLVGRTVLVVAHRLSTVRHVDRVAVMDAGRVVEEGTHQELLRKGGVYAGLHAQVKGSGVFPLPELA